MFTQVEITWVRIRCSTSVTVLERADGKNASALSRGLSLVFLHTLQNLERVKVTGSRPCQDLLDLA